MKLTKKSGILIGSISLLVVLAIVAAVILLNGGYLKVSGGGEKTSGAVSDGLVSSCSDTVPIALGDDEILFSYTSSEVARLRYLSGLKTNTYYDITDRETIDLLLSNYHDIVYEEKTLSPEEELLGTSTRFQLFDDNGNELASMTTIPYVFNIGKRVLYAKGLGPIRNDQTVQSQLKAYMTSHTIDSRLGDYISKVQKIEYFYLSDSGFHFSLDITQKKDIEKILGLYAALPYFEMQTDDYRLKNFSSDILCYDVQGNITVAFPTWEICYPQEQVVIRCPDLTARSKVNEQVKELMAQFVKEGTYTPYHYADEMIH